MRDTSTSTISRLLFVKPPRMNFAVLVGELDAALASCSPEELTLTWDCDDMAIFDLEGARIVLGHVQEPGPGFATCLVASVGPMPGANPVSPLLERSEPICRLIVDRIIARFPPDRQDWLEIAAPVTVDLLDEMIDKMARPQPEPVVQSAAQPSLPEIRSDAAQAARLVANDVPDLPPLLQTELERVREALYPSGNAWPPAPIGGQAEMPVRAHAPLFVPPQVMQGKRGRDLFGNPKKAEPQGPAKAPKRVSLFSKTRTADNRPEEAA